MLSVKMTQLTIPSEFEREINSWNIDLQSLFVAFLKKEFNKIKKFSELVEQSRDEFELKQATDNIDNEILWNLSDKIQEKSELTDEKADELADELKERVAKRHEL